MCDNNKERKHITINILPQSPGAWFCIMWIGLGYSLLVHGEENK